MHRHLSLTCYLSLATCHLLLPVATIYMAVVSTEAWPLLSYRKRGPSAS